MNYKYIKDAKVSSIILGTDYYGSSVDEKTCFRLYDIFSDCGGNHIDTAHLYVGGESERMLGKWLKQHGRDGIFVATKGAHPPIDNMNASRLTKREIQKDLEESLCRLGIDCIDLYWLHRDNAAADPGEVIEILNEFIKAGKIKMIGCSNWRASRIAEANAYARKHGLEGFSASQIKWSLAKTCDSYSDDPTLVEMSGTEYAYYSETKLPIAAFASQGKGFFSKLYTGGESALSQKAKDRYLCAENLKRFEKIKHLTEKYQTSPGAIVLSYLSSMTDVTAMPIIGCKNENQLKDSLKAADLTLTDEEIIYLTK